jgi:GT2 family glycosyltransferase/glycosyltransferase involved in cell wall biosynthesis
LYLGENEDLPEPGADNPDGHWENRWFVELNEAVLNASAGGWDHPPAKPVGPASGQADRLRRDAGAVLRRLEGPRPWGWKDPRNSLTLPFWLSLLPDLQVVICLRNPLEVALSLRKRNDASYAQGLSLWEAYNRRLLEAAPPGRRLVTHYDAYFSRGRAELLRVLRFLRLDVAPEVLDRFAQIPSPDRRHTRLTGKHLREAGLPAAVGEFYARLCAEAQWEDGGPPAAPRGPTVSNGQPAQELNKWMLDAEGLRRDLEERTAWARRLEADLAKRDGTIQELQEQLGEQTAWAKRSAEQVARQDATIRALRDRLREQGDLRGRVAALERAAQKQTEHLGALAAALASKRVAVTAEVDKAAAYQQLNERIRQTVQTAVPPEATVIVISKGDEGLLRLPGRSAWHFPQSDEGAYAGHYPPDGRTAVNHLEALRAKGGEFLLLPGTALWWLDHYGDFRRHLDAHYARVWSGDDCVIYRLAGPAAAGGTLPALPRPDKYDIVCFAVIDWRFRFQRPQQLLTQFARHGHRVFYVGGKFHQDGPAPRVDELAERLHDVRLPGPVGLNIYRHDLDEAALDSLVRALNELRCRVGLAETVALVHLPFWAPLARAARQRWGWKVVYDCMDEHGGFSGNQPGMLRHEAALVEESDLVVATSHLLYEKAAPRARRALLLPNAADYEHFRTPGPGRPLDGLPGPVVGYYGAIAEWFDVDMVRAAAQARPDWQFVLIGHTFGADVAWLRNLPNVHLPGELPYAELPGYLHRFDVACIPFRLTPLTRATNPVKFYEYLSAGKPVVAVDLPELAPYRDCFYPVRTAEEFVPQVEAALRENSADKVRVRTELARRNTWAERHGALSTAVAGLYKAAVIVVSYNNLEYLRLCLESLWAKTSYPHFEVVVVDNGSRHEVLAYLRAAAAKEPRLKLVANGTNLGFARANNIGIEAAGDCDYVVLLNDDTVVTRGWLAKLIGYLTDPGIGLVGPVTNWAGNEARIDVGYRDLEGMDAFAEQYTAGHAGRCFDIPMLAMFCVGLRKRLLDQIGPLDERFGIGMFEDDDFSLRVRQAWYRVVCAEDVFVHHWGRSSFRRLDKAAYERLFEENRRKFEAKWGRAWQPHRGRSHRPVVGGK